MNGYNSNKKDRVEFKAQENGKSKSNDADIEKYKDISGVSLKKLNFGLWYVEHRQRLKVIFIVFLILIGAISWVYTIYGFGYYLLRGMSEDELLASQITKTPGLSHNYILQIAPKDLMLGPIKILKSDEKKYDIFIQIKNPSDRHWADFDYYFKAGSNETKTKRGFILPGETKYLLALGEEFNFNPSNVQFGIKGMSWHKIDRHELPDWEKFRNERLDIGISDTKFTPAKASGLSGKLSLNILDFTAINKTPYSYWNADFIILLYGGANIIGINSYSLGEFMSGQSRGASITWPGAISQASKIEVIPNINIFDNANYIKYSGEGEEK